MATRWIALATALVLAPHVQAGGPDLVVGAAEDNVKQRTLAAARANMELARRAGLRALRITAQCARGQTAPSPDERTRLRMAGEAAHRAGITLSSPSTRTAARRRRSPPQTAGPSRSSPQRSRARCRACAT